MSALTNTIIGGDIICGPFKFSKFIENLKIIVKNDNALLALWMIDPVSAQLYTLYSKDPEYEFISSIKEALDVIDIVGGKRKQRGGGKLVTGMAILILLYQMAIISANVDYKSYPNMREAVSKWGADAWRSHINHDIAEPVQPDQGFFAWLFGFKPDLKDYNDAMLKYNEALLANSAEGEYEEHMMNLESANAATELTLAKTEEKKEDTKNLEAQKEVDKVQITLVQAQTQYKTLEMLERSAEREHETLQLLIKVLIGVGVAIAGAAFWLGRVSAQGMNARVEYRGDPAAAAQNADERGLPPGNRMPNQNLLGYREDPRENPHIGRSVRRRLGNGDARGQEGGRRRKMHTKKQKKRGTRRR